MKFPLKGMFAGLILCLAVSVPSTVYGSSKAPLALVIARSVRGLTKHHLDRAARALPPVRCVQPGERPDLRKGFYLQSDMRPVADMLEKEARENKDGCVAMDSCSATTLLAWVAYDPAYRRQFDDLAHRAREQLRIPEGSATHHRLQKAFRALWLNKYFLSPGGDISEGLDARNLKVTGGKWLIPCMDLIPCRDKDKVYYSVGNEGPVCKSLEEWKADMAWGFSNRDWLLEDLGPEEMEEVAGYLAELDVAGVNLKDPNAWMLEQVGLAPNLNMKLVPSS